MDNLDQKRMQVEHAMLEMAQMVRTSSDEDFEKLLMGQEFGKQIMISPWKDMKNQKPSDLTFGILRLRLRVN